jgi:hypothetical protein
MEGLEVQYFSSREPDGHVSFSYGSATHPSVHIDFDSL